jgi:PST family polysaccharide transporter
MTIKNKQAHLAESSESIAARGGRDATSLDRSLVRGVAWNAAVKLLSQVLTWASTLIVARALTPDDYGLVAMAFIFISLVEMVSDFGMGQSIVKHRDLTTRQIAQINGLCVLFGLAGWSLTCVAAYPISVFFQAPGLVAVVVVLGSGFFITSFRSVPLSLLQRDMRFRATAINEGINAIVLSMVMVALALSGFQYWALVIGNLLGGFLSTLLACRISPAPLAWPRYRDIKEPVRFGSHMVALRFCYYVISSADSFVAGKVLGQRLLGAYSLAMTIAAIPVEKISGLLVRVLPPVISAVQNDSIALRRYVTGITEALSLLTMPASVGLALVASDLVPFALGDKWRPAILPLQILGISMAQRSTFMVIPSVAAIIGLSRVSMQVSAVSAIVLPIAFYVGSFWGIGGVAAVWLIVYPFLIVPHYYVVFRRIDMTTSEYLRALWPAASCTAVMAAVVYGLHLVIFPHWPTAVRLTVEILVGALSYSGALIAFHKTRLSALRNVSKLLLAKS